MYNFLHANQDLWVPHFHVIIFSSSLKTSFNIFHWVFCMCVSVNVLYCALVFDRFYLRDFNFIFKELSITNHLSHFYLLNCAFPNDLWCVLIAIANFHRHVWICFRVLYPNILVSWLIPVPILNYHNFCGLIINA